MRPAIKKELNRILKKAETYHKIWWDFCDHFKKWYKGKDKEFNSELMARGGYEAMERVRKYATTHSDIHFDGCDDTLAMGSMIVYIPHPKHGITVIYIPQNCRDINEFFLYHTHALKIANTLNNLIVKYKLKEDR